MPRNFSRTVCFDKKKVLAVFLPYIRPNGRYYEVNIASYPRFHVHWSPLGRYDITEPVPGIPDSLLLAISDLLEKETL